MYSQAILEGEERTCLFAGLFCVIERRLKVNSIQTGGGEGVVQGGRPDFNFWERPWYLSNTYHTWWLLLWFIGERDCGKHLRQVCHLLPWQPLFDAMFNQILAFNVFLH